MTGYRRVPAHPALAAVVAGYTQRRFDAGGGLPGVALPARTDCFIEFYLGEPYRARRDGVTEPAPEIALVAPHATPGTELLILGRVDTFTIHFTATGCHRLFGCDVAELRDRAVLASDAIGRHIRRLQGDLNRAGDLATRVAAADAFLAGPLQRARSADVFDLVADRLARGDAIVRVDRLARECGCSERQLNRVFQARVGLTPALHGRLLRFERLLALHRRRPTAALTELAHAAGYFDQPHLVRDCRAFTLRPPGAFLREWTPAERIGG